MTQGTLTAGDYSLAGLNPGAVERSPCRFGRLPREERDRFERELERSNAASCPPPCGRVSLGGPWPCHIDPPSTRKRLRKRGGLHVRYRLTFYFARIDAEPSG